MFLDSIIIVYEWWKDIYNKNKDYKSKNLLYSFKNHVTIY